MAEWLTDQMTVHIKFEGLIPVIEHTFAPVNVINLKKILKSQFIPKILSKTYSKSTLKLITSSFLKINIYKYDVSKYKIFT